MLLNWVQLGLTWYYFNVIAIAYIVYMLLQIALARARKATINQSESESRENNRIVSIIVYTAIAAIIYFVLREYISELKEIWTSAVESIQEWYAN